MAGRPTKLTPEAQAAIVKAIDIGATRKDAAEAAGVDYRTFLNWLERGEKAGRGIYFQFFQAVTTAEAQVRINFTAVIAKAANGGDWRASVEYLKRRDKQHWGDNVDVTTGGGPVKLTWMEDAPRE